jgi:DNA modification methylase
VADPASVLRFALDEALFPPHLELLPGVDERYELELAFYESRILSGPELLRNGAYFARVRDTLTRHFLMCSGEPVRLPQHSSSRLRSFFQTKQFKTGYGTHGLFPYRGKFHPQMIKGLLNVMGLKPGETVLDPMMGSGTVLIEAALMGINSVGVDASPFCQVMAQAKLDGLTMPVEPLHDAVKHGEAVFRYFSELATEHAKPKRQVRNRRVDPFTLDLFAPAPIPRGRRKLPIDGLTNETVFNFLRLAFLDSAGYSERSQRKPPLDQFLAILERYVFVVEKIQNVLRGAESELGGAKSLVGDARDLPLDDASVDGVLFSPPYSFAIDYLENDASHLDFLNADLGQLRGRMIGLRGETLTEKYDVYKRDMELVLVQCARVLRRGRFCVVVVGTNNNQLARILDVDPEDVQGIDELLADLASGHGLRLVRKIARQITGMANTMRTEFIVMLQRE